MMIPNQTLQSPFTSLLDALCPPPIAGPLLLPAFDENNGPGGCTLAITGNPFGKGAALRATIEFAVPGTGVVHAESFQLNHAQRRARFISACVEAVKSTSVAPNENELRQWLEKRLLVLGREAQKVSESVATLNELPAVIGKQRQDAVVLLEDPSLLYRLSCWLHDRVGFAGEQTNALLLYLALTSRLLNAILSCVIKNESGAGKSYGVETILKFFPPEAYHSVSAMSRQSLVYSRENFKNKMIVIAEAPGMEASEFNLRTLLSEGRLVFDTVEKDEATGEHHTRQVKKEGPTGLILTTTKAALHKENETRYLSLSVDESQQQTRRIMEVTARKFEQGSVGRDPDLTVWINAQRMLQTRIVAVPFASALVAKLPEKPLRMRRDVQKLLTAIQACALLHQRQRPTSGNEIQATLADYYIVKRLLEPIFFGSLYSIPVKSREVMEAIKKIYKDKNSKCPSAAISTAGTLPEEELVTTKELREELGWSKGAVLKWAEPLAEYEWTIEGPHDNSPREYRPGYEPEINEFPAVEELLGEGESIEVVDPISGKMLKFERPPEQQSQVFTCVHAA